MVDGRTDRQTDRQTGRQADRQAGRHTHTQVSSWSIVNLFKLALKTKQKNQQNFEDKKRWCAKEQP